MEKTSILFLAYDYPPVLSPESVQVQRRAAILAKQGHKVFILTVHNNPMYESLDDDLLVGSKQIEIIRTKKPFAEKFLNILCKLLNITDRKLWWFLYASGEALRIIKSNNIKIVYSHSTPLVSHLVGLFVKRGLGNSVRWVAHFSDPWVQNPYLNYNKLPYRYVNKLLEEAVVNSADVLSVTSEKTKKLFCLDNYTHNNKTYILPHVYDNKMFVGSIRRAGKIKIVHTGNIYGLRTIKYLLMAISELRERDSFEFHFYGKIKNEETQYVNMYNLQGCVKICEQVPYHKSLALMSESDVLLVVDAPLENSPFFPSKLADYIGANKTIMALTPHDSTTTEILTELGFADFIAASDNVDAIKNILLRVKDGFCNIKPNSKRECYDMENSYIAIKDVFFDK